LAVRWQIFFPCRSRPVVLYCYDQASKLAVRRQIFFTWTPCPCPGIKIGSPPGTRDSVTRFSTLGFFRQSITPRPLINTLKYFRILIRIRRAIRPLSFIPHSAGSKFLTRLHDFKTLLLGWIRKSNFLFRGIRNFRRNLNLFHEISRNFLPIILRSFAKIFREIS
jgi:hypothetical protein